MTTIQDKLRFNFDGKWSDEYNLINVVLSNGMFEETFVAEREIVETSIVGSQSPIFHRIEDNPMQFDMIIAFEDGFNEDMINEISDWLFQDYYKELFFEDKTDKIYRCIAIGESSLIHNGLNQGYFTVTMRCDSSRVYSPVKIESFSVSDTAITTLNINNFGSDTIFPEISILKKGDGNISMDINGEIFEVRDLTNLEDIYINCEREIIETDIIGVYRYDNVIGEFPKFIRGSNTIKIQGESDIKIRYREKYKI